MRMLSLHLPLNRGGNFSFDNLLVGRFIHPFAGARKNSLFFGSGQMAEVSATYHTVISTCRMHGILALEYLRTGSSGL